MCDLSIKAPATAGDLFQVAPRSVWMRKAIYWQSRFCETVAICDSTGTCLAVGFFYKERVRRWRFALVISDKAVTRMIGLCRIAHLTLKKIADTGTLIVAEVNPENQSGRRMAALVGFSRSKLRDPRVWIWR